MRPKVLLRHALTGLAGGILALLLLYALFYTAAYLLLGGESGNLITGPCGERIELEKASPDSRYVAVAFMRDCGATTGSVAHVNLRPKQASFRVNRAGTIDDGCVFVSNYGTGCSLRWKEARHLVIQSRFSKVFLKKNAWRDLTVSYE
jgi:hypothetical protein